MYQKYKKSVLFGGQADAIVCNGVVRWREKRSLWQGTRRQHLFLCQLDQSSNNTSSLYSVCTLHYTLYSICTVHHITFFVNWTNHLTTSQHACCTVHLIIDFANQTNHPATLHTAQYTIYSHTVNTRKNEHTGTQKITLWCQTTFSQQYHTNVVKLWNY